MRALFSLFVFAAVLCAGGHDAPAAMAPEQALARLRAGNTRFVKHKEKHPDISFDRRRSISRDGQHPYAVILGCSDSRVPPELIFDEGLGDLFVIRDAGNVVDDEVLGSIEYAVEHLGVRLVVVLGHEKCGAVSAAVAGGEAHGHIKSVMKAIQPAVDETAGMPGDHVHNCVLANARRVARLIRESEPILKPAVDRKQIQVVAADYDLETFMVEFLDLPAAAGKNALQSALK
ncbi:MAG: carbonic anhydrase [Bryobacteraceae bacterium]|nr:carbonic anhydrase [Bryobacteraceae bacterium]